ncbi:MAG TPA: glucose-1-phosphate cytidylyltransferase [Vicinamibacterales bacterium]|nr:glucose-1-phosphate cytidylyltransferase [Vicinamibacterales bacterium]
MKVILLAGGRGTRLAEETATLPKPMVEIGGRPLLLHLMQYYADYGFKEFLVACGYRGEIIKEYFRSLPVRLSDYVLDLTDGSLEIVKPAHLDWRIAAIDTGIETSTGGRILRLRALIGNETFMVTYGDGLSTVDLGALAGFHRSHGRLATVTAVRPPARFGALVLDGPRVLEFTEKPQAREGWINGGFFVFQPGVFEYLDDESPLERGPLERLAEAGELLAFRHDGFWQPMDTLRDKQLLEALWQSGEAPWIASRRVAGGAAASS